MLLGVLADFELAALAAGALPPAAAAEPAVSGRVPSGWPRMRPWFG